MARVDAAAAAVAVADARLRSAGGLVERAQDFAEGPEHLVDMTLLDDERRGERDDVARGADQQALLVAFEEGVEGALRRLAGARLQLDAGDDAEIAQVDDVAGPLERMDGIFPIGRQVSRPLEQPLFLVDVEGGEAGGAGNRMS